MDLFGIPNESEALDLLIVHYELHEYLYELVCLRDDGVYLCKPTENNWSILLVEGVGSEMVRIDEFSLVH